MNFFTTKRARLLIALAILVFGTSVMSFATEYDSDNVVRVMRGNLRLIGEIKDAASKTNWHLTATKLFEIAEGMMEVLPYDPPRGTKEHWDLTIGAFIDTAFEGIGACGRRDVEALNGAIAKLSALNREGHMEHKPR